MNTSSKPEKQQKEKLDKLFEQNHSKLETVFETLYQKKNRKSTTVQLFVHYSLLELCLKFCHQSKDLPGFEEFLDFTLECVTEYSMPILLEFIKMVQEVVNSYQFTESQNLSNWYYLIKILRRLQEALGKNNLGVGEVKGTCVKYSELLNDSILKLSFLTDQDFTEALKELTYLLKEFQASEMTKQFQLFSTIINNFYMLIVGIEKRNAHEYLKDTPELVITIFDIAQNFVTTANPAELSVAFKLLQKVLYLLQLNNTKDDTVSHILTSLITIKKKLASQNDESLYQSYLETLRKFLLAHIENVKRPVQEQMMLAFFTQLQELYSESLTKRYKTLGEVILEYLRSTITILKDLMILGELNEREGEKTIYAVIEKFPKEKTEAGSPTKVSSPKKVSSPTQKEQAIVENAPVEKEKEVESQVEKEKQQEPEKETEKEVEKETEKEKENATAPVAAEGDIEAGN